jgi:hypothetical protein
MYIWPATSGPVAVQMRKMMLNCRAHFRAVTTFLDFLNSVQFISFKISHIQNTHDLPPLKGATSHADTHQSLKYEGPSQAGAEAMLVERFDRVPSSLRGFALNSS